MPIPTARLQLQEPETSDAVSEYRASITTNATILDAAALFQSGTYAARPASPTVAGTLYFASDIDAIYMWTGSAWLTIAAGTTPPIGAVQQYAGTTDPVDPDGTVRWMIADGRPLSRSGYATMFARCSITYGSGNGSTTFNIPNLLGRMPIGAGTGSGLTNRILGTPYGAETVTLTTAQIPAHNHVDSGHGHVDNGHAHSDSGHGHGITDNGHTHSSQLNSVNGSGYIPGTSGSSITTGQVGAVGGSSVPNAGGSLWGATQGTHNHTIVAAFSSVATITGNANIQTGHAAIATGTANIQNTGGGGSHANIPPTLALNHIVRVL